MRGRRVAPSLPRRIVVDLMRLTNGVPSVAAVRRMNLAAVRAARAAHAERPPWSGIFTKALALVADEVPALRRIYVRFPTGHFHEYVGSAACVAIEREFDGEAAVFFGVIQDPSRLSLSEITRRIRTYSEAPLSEIREFQRAMNIARLPGPLRWVIFWLCFHLLRQRANYLGTFGVTGISREGADLTQIRVPGTTAIYCGPIASDGSADVHLVFDHRVLDGMAAARILSRLEQILTCQIVAELRE